jgi:hypothetical protein
MTQWTTSAHLRPWFGNVTTPRMDLFIRTIGLPRATIRIGLANLVYNLKRLTFLKRRAAAAAG